MIPTVRLGRTDLEVTRLGLGGYPFGGVNKARNWDPFLPEGRATAIETIHAALDAGINYIDTAPSYGDGHSESLIGEATHRRREDFYLGTKVGHGGLSAEDVTTSVKASLKRLDVDMIDLIQIHGGMYSQGQVDHILNGGPLEALEALRDAGYVRFIGFTVEEPWTARPLIETGRFDVVQVRYNLIYQAAALHVLDDARQADMGVTIMRPMTSGILQRLAESIAPQWQEAHDIYDAALRFVLADSRVHVANVGMRWPSEVARNVALAESFEPTADMADLPRLTAQIYKTDDERNAHDGR